MITRLLDLILKQDDPERSFVKFKDGDDLVLLVNNQGGMSALEMGAVVDETLTQLGKFTPPLVPPQSVPSNCRSLARYHLLTSRNSKHYPPQNSKWPIHGLNEHARNLPYPPQFIQRFRRM